VADGVRPYSLVIVTRCAVQGAGHSLLVTLLPFHQISPLVSNASCLS